METGFLVALKHVAQETGCLFDFGMDAMSFHYEVSHLLFPVLESFLSIPTMLSFQMSYQLSCESNYIASWLN